MLITFHLTRQFRTTAHRDIFAMSTTLAICGQLTAEVHFPYILSQLFSFGHIAAFGMPFLHSTVPWAKTKSA